MSQDKLQVAEERDHLQETVSSPDVVGGQHITCIFKELLIFRVSNDTHPHALLASSAVNKRNKRKLTSVYLALFKSVLYFLFVTARGVALFPEACE
jgi:hypothetical protein